MSEVRVATIQVGTLSAGAVVDRTLRLIELDTAFATLAGATTPESLIGRLISDLLPNLEEPLLEVLASGRILPVVQIQVGGDGLAPLRLAPLHSSRGTVVGVELTISSADANFEHDQDAVALSALRSSDWRATMAKIQASEARLRATFEHAPLGIAHVGLNGRWLRVNERLCSITGYQRDQLLALSFQAITYPDDLAPDLEQMTRLLAGASETYEIEKRYLRADGGTVWINQTVSLIRTADARRTTLSPWSRRLIGARRPRRSCAFRPSCLMRWVRV